MRHTATEIYQLSRAAGLSVADSIIAVAVALAESSGDDTAIGDVSLQTTQWGPSVGIWQIRTLNAEMGTGSLRDINALKGNPAHQARAMASISGSGRDWSPWTAYNRGIYERFLGQAENAAKASGAAIQPTSAGTAIPGVDSVVEGVKTTAVQLLAGTLGIALVGVGLVLAVSPASRAAAKKALGSIGL